MALQKTITTAQGIEVTNSYQRVEFVTIDKNKSSISFRLRVYKDITSNSYLSDAVFNCSYNINESNPIQQAYEHLKTLPQFADAADV